ncbi:hypothetical protein FOBRF1_008185 [Fusarium oxysporum]
MLPHAPLSWVSHRSKEAQPSTTNSTATLSSGAWGSFRGILTVGSWYYVNYCPLLLLLVQRIERGKSKGQYRSSFPPPRLELQRKTSEPGFKQYNKLVVTVPLPHNLPILQLSDPSFDPPRPSRPTLPL